MTIHQNKYSMYSVDLIRHQFDSLASSFWGLAKQIYWSCTRTPDINGNWNWNWNWWPTLQQRFWKWVNTAVSVVKRAVHCALCYSRAPCTTKPKTILRIYCSLLHCVHQTSCADGNTQYICHLNIYWQYIFHLNSPLGKDPPRESGSTNWAIIYSIVFSDIWIADCQKLQNSCYCCPQ